MSSQHQQLPPPNSARLAITSLCNVLQQYGVTSCEPETIRQAKFDGPVAGLMWRILHDTVLVVLAGGHDGPAFQSALLRQWDQVSLELAADEEFPQEGALLVVRQLASWGAPADLLREIAPIGTATASASAAAATTAGARAGAGMGAGAGGGGGPGLPTWPRVRSRPLLLALGWLVAAAALFERRVSELEPGPELRAMLPPYPQDSCTNPAVQAVYDAAAQDSRDHVQRLPAGGASVAGLVSGGGGGGGGRGGRTRPAPADPFGPSPTSVATEAVWADVETAAQRAVMLCGRVRSRLVALQAATDCRHRLSHSLWSRQAAASPSSRPLTPYELQLCAQPAQMQRHMTALESATLALLEQQELAAHGSLFFEWLGSVLEEEHHHQGQLAAGRGAGRQGGQAGRSGPLGSLEHLPYVGSEAGSRLASHLEAQLEAAVQAAEPELSAARRRLEAQLRQGPSGSGPGGGAAARSQPAVNLDHFLSLAEQAVSEHGPYGDDDDGGGGGGGGVAAAAGPSPSSQLLVPSTDDADTEPPWGLPNDVAAALAAVHDARRRQQCTAEVEAERFRQLRYAALSRYDFSALPDGSGPGAAAAPVGGPLASVLAAAAGIGTTGPATAAPEDTQRLLAAVLAAARPLARARASHKAALMAALADLPEGYLVAGL